MEKLPLYNAIIAGDNDGICCMSLVDCPATETNWVCFDKDKPVQKFAIQNAEEHILSSVAMIADTPIYRCDCSGEYYIQYPKETIKLMAEKWLKDNTHNRIDLMHNGEILSEGVVSLVEVYIKDEEKGINPNFVDVPDGSLMCSYKVHDEALWEACKDGTFNGLSLEGFFSVERVTEQEQYNKNDEGEEVPEICDECGGKVVTVIQGEPVYVCENCGKHFGTVPFPCKNNKSEYNMIQKLRETLKKLLAEFGEVKTDLGTVEYFGDSIGEGVEVTVDGKPAPSATYTCEDGTQFIVKEGVVESIVEAEPEEEEKPVEEATEETPEEEEKPAEVETPEETPEDEETPEETPDAKDEEIASLNAKIAELEAKIAELEALVEKPAEKPITEQFEAITDKESKDKNLSAKLSGIR